MTASSFGPLLSRRLQRHGTPVSHLFLRASLPRTSASGAWRLHNRFASKPISQLVNVMSRLVCNLSRGEPAMETMVLLKTKDPRTRRSLKSPTWRSPREVPTRSNTVGPIVVIRQPVQLLTIQRLQVCEGVTSSRPSRTSAAYAVSPRHQPESAPAVTSLALPWFAQHLGELLQCLRPLRGLSICTVCSHRAGRVRLVQLGLSSRSITNLAFRLIWFSCPRSLSLHSCSAGHRASSPLGLGSEMLWLSHVL